MQVDYAPKKGKYERKSIPPSPFSLSEKASLEAFKAKLDVALGSLVWWLVTPHIAGCWNKMITVALFNPGHSRIL